MSRTTTILIGATVGAGVGYLVGTLIAEQLWPEYYTEEELQELQQNILEENQYRLELDDKEPVTVEKGLTKVGPTSTIDYHKYYSAKNPKPSLEEVAGKYNLTLELDKDEGDDEVVDEYDIEDPHIEEYPDDYSGPIPYFDTHDLSEVDPSDWIAERDERTPFIITEEEFRANEDDCRQAYLRYYVTDDVLTDDKNRPVYNVNKAIGDYAVDNFGVFTDRDEFVYVQNPQLKVQYQVTRMDESYEESVLGGKPRQASKPVVVHKNVFDEYDNEEPPERPIHGGKPRK